MHHSVVKFYYFSGPLLALALAREEAVEGWRDMLGPKEVDQAKQDKPDRYGIFSLLYRCMDIFSIQDT